MRIAGTTWRAIGDHLIVLAGLVACLFGVQMIGAWPDWQGAPRHLVVDVVFAAGLMVASALSTLMGVRFKGGARAAWVIGSVVLAAGLYELTEGTLAAWMLVVAVCVLLSWLDHRVSVTLFRRRLGRWVTRGTLSVAGTLVPVICNQIESRFAEEEFFALVRGVALIPFFLLFLVGQGHLNPDRAEGPVARRARTWCTLALGGFATVMMSLVVCGVVAYQASFYPLDAPGYPGVTAESPFVCGQALPDPAQPSGEDVYRQLLARVEANPHKGAPEYGMLALSTGEQRWAQAFRESLLTEAAEGRFTAPAHSVKWGQYEAALRAYYVPRVDGAFPGLFSNEENTILREWFAAINRRALTVEWVDWMYALAFTKWPEGPYENQENGAGLLALLETADLAAADLSPVNRDYLERTPRGWAARFRNTDDAFIYQAEWLNNALFLSQLADTADDNVRLSFEWLLLQALPDGAALRYNHPTGLSLAGIAYLGAGLLEDPTYIWLADRALGYEKAHRGYLPAQPGVEQPFSLVGRSPDEGSCLLYGDSGLPNQEGPLAPDKIVLRDGWSEDATYLLLNLRFTGWHRYKATNTITLIYQNGPVVVEELDGETRGWLPVGRSAFRDKRIPRENLNGLLVERNGMSAVLHQLTGVGGCWSQDPPHYARVIGFEAGEEMDWSHSRLEKWRGWQHDRWIYLYHDGGPIVIVDEAQGPPGSDAAVIWHLADRGVSDGSRILLRPGDTPTEMVVVPIETRDPQAIMSDNGGGSGQRVLYYASPTGRMRAVTLLLFGQWVGADVQVDAEEQIVRITREGTSIALPLPWQR